MTNGINLERTVAKMESTLSQAAIVPLFGAIAGAGKVLLGIIQTIGGLLGMIFSSPFLYTKMGKEVFCRAGSHFVNGLANIFAGTLEAIPVVGTFINCSRTLRQEEGSISKPKLFTGQEHSFLIGYRILEDHPGNAKGRPLSDLIAEGVDPNSFTRTSPLISI